MNNKRTAILALFGIIGMMLIAPLAIAQEPIKLHPDSGKEQATLNADIEKLDQGILRVASALNYAAATLQREHHQIWSLPDDRLLALLNANVQRTIAIATAKDKAATEINSLLNQLNIARFTARAPIGLGREDVKFDQDKKLFVLIPKAEPTEQP